MHSKTYTVTSEKETDVNVPTIAWQLNTLEAGQPPRVIGIFSTPERAIKALRDCFGLTESIRIMIGARKTAYEQVELTVVNFPFHREFTIGNPADSRSGKFFSATIYPIKEITIDMVYEFPSSNPANSHSGDFFGGTTGPLRR